VVERLRAMEPALPPYLRRALRRSRKREGERLAGAGVETSIFFLSVVREAESTSLLRRVFREI